MLDFHALAQQLERMLDDESLRPSQVFAAVEAARSLCAATDGAAFNEIVARALASDDLPQGWHPARLLEDDSQPSPQLNTAHASPPAPENLCVVATDGSQIYPDAHQIAGCYLINVSAVQLRYAALRDDASTRADFDNAQMSATPQLFAAADSWGEAARENSGSVNKELVDARRHVEELSRLSQLLNALPPDENAVGFSDGIFDLRVSAAQPWRQFALDENESALDALRLANQPVCGYIAAPRANDVVTALRLVMLESPREYSHTAKNDASNNISRDGDFSNENEARDKVTQRTTEAYEVDKNQGAAREYSRADSDSETSPRENGADVVMRSGAANEKARDADADFSLLSDARLFDALLQIGERSAVFVTTRMVSPSQRAYSTGAASTREDASRHASCFCYLKIADAQVARLEFPRWVATRADWLERLHAALLQQIEKGDGYPVALMEAHEHAVVRASERELFYSLLEEMMMARGHSPQRSAKAISKTRPLV